MKSSAVYVVAAVRTPIGSFGGILKDIPSTQLGALVIREALAKIQLNHAEVNEVLMGSVLQANLGQAPARQAAKFAGLPNEEDLEREINVASGEPEPAPEGKPALPPRFTRKSSGWK